MFSLIQTYWFIQDLPNIKAFDSDDSITIFERCYINTVIFKKNTLFAYCSIFILLTIFHKMLFDAGVVVKELYFCIGAHLHIAVLQ